MSVRKNYGGTHIPFMHTIDEGDRMITIAVAQFRANHSLPCRRLTRVISMGLGRVDTDLTSRYTSSLGEMRGGAATSCGA